MEKEASTHNVERIYFKNGNFKYENGKIIKAIHHVTTTALTSKSEGNLTNDLQENEQEIIKKYLEKHGSYKKANAYLIGENINKDDGVTLPVTFFTIRRKKK